MRIYLFFAALLFSSLLNAQSKIAVVNGTTGALQSTTTLDSAMQIAQDGDYIYLPGGNFTGGTINKRVFVFGAGQDPDSTAATGRTVIEGLTVSGTSSGGQLEGCFITTLILGDNSGPILNNFIIKRCYISSLTGVGGATNNFFIENIISGGISGFGGNNVFQKNILNYFSNASDNTFENNIFTSSGYIISNSINCTFSNNIFITRGPLEYYEDGDNSSHQFYYNNLSRSIFPDSQSSTGNITTSIENIFVKYDTSFTNIYAQDLHLIANSPGLNAGTDGTDVGIYGTNSPTKEGWVPSNPHISYQSVSQQTDTNGNLKATFKVKAQSN